MVAQEANAKERIVSLLDELPVEAFPEVVTFLEFQKFKHASRPADAPRYRPTPMGGLWKGVEITAEDIAEARREMWGRFADDEP